MNELKTPETKAQINARLNRERLAKKKAWHKKHIEDFITALKTQNDHAKHPVRSSTLAPVAKAEPAAKTEPAKAEPAKAEPAAPKVPPLPSPVQPSSPPPPPKVKKKAKVSSKKKKRR